jgi:hypothetical protein
MRMRLNGQATHFMRVLPTFLHELAHGFREGIRGLEQAGEGHAGSPGREKKNPAVAGARGGNKTERAIDHSTHDDMFYECFKEILMAAEKFGIYGLPKKSHKFTPTALRRFDQIDMAVCSLSGTLSSSPSSRSSSFLLSSFLPFFSSLLPLLLYVLHAFLHPSALLFLSSPSLLLPNLHPECGSSQRFQKLCVNPKNLPTQIPLIVTMGDGKKKSVVFDASRENSGISEFLELARAKLNFRGKLTGAWTLSGEEVTEEMLRGMEPETVIRVGRKK